MNKEETIQKSIADFKGDVKMMALDQTNRFNACIAFGEGECGLISGISVFARKDIDESGRSEITLEVNWPAIGAVPLDKAEWFKSQMELAISTARGVESFIGGLK